MKLSKNKKPIQLLQIGEQIIYGKYPTFLALKNQKRKIFQIFINKNNVEDLQKFTQDNQIDYRKLPIKLVENDFLNNLLPPNSLHQGFILNASILPLMPFVEFCQIISKSKELPAILILDSLTDPHNIGAIVRSAAAFDIRNIIITERNFPRSSPVISKSSCGMIEIVNLISAFNLNSLIKDLKNLGYWIVGLDGDAREEISQIKNYMPVALIVGSEGKGIRPLVKSNCDILLRININKNVESLNASNAAAIALYQLNAVN